MKLKVQDLLQASNSVAVLARKDLPAKVSYRIGKLFRALQREERDYRDAYDRCLAKYGKPIADKPGSFNIPPAKLKAFNKEVEQLNAEDVELEGVLPVDYTDIAELSLPAEVFVGIFPLLINHPDAEPAEVEPKPVEKKPAKR